MIAPIQIPPAQTIDELRLALTAAVNQVITQVNLELSSTNLNVNGGRVTNVGDPVALTDAVTKRWVLNQLEKLR